MDQGTFLGLSKKGDKNLSTAVLNRKIDIFRHSLFCGHLMNHRLFLLCLCVVFLEISTLACTPYSKFKRHSGRHRLGWVAYFLHNLQPSKQSSMFVMRDDAGWSVLDGRCPKEGCDLSPALDRFQCPCCKSTFTLAGEFAHGPAEKNLSFYEMSYSNGVLFAHPDKIVDKNYRFVVVSLEPTIKQMRDKMAKEGPSSLLAIPSPIADENYYSKEPDAKEFKETEISYLYGILEKELGPLEARNRGAKDSMKRLEKLIENQKKKDKNK